MKFTRTSKFQRTNPEDYKSKLVIMKINDGLDEHGNKVRPIRDTWWIVDGSKDNVYMLHIHMNEILFLAKSIGTSCIYGRIECECPSFVYCNQTPRHCKHSAELARRFFGDHSFQYKYIDDYRYLYDEPDTWCEDNYKILESMLDEKPKKKKFHSHAEKILLEQEGKWK